MIALAPVENEAVPGTVATPVCVIAPPAVTARLPPPVSVIAGRLIAALSKASVRFLRLASPAKLGRTAPAFVLRRLTSRMLETVPPNTGALTPRLFACVPSRMSEPAALTARVVVPPVAVIAPVSVMAPPAVRFRLAPTPEVPRAREALLMTAALLAPVLLSETAPVKSLAWVSVIALAPAVKEAAPAPAACVTAPVCVIAPVEVTARVPTADA